MTQHSDDKALARLMEAANRAACKGKRDVSAQTGKTHWFNAAKHRPMRDGYYEFRCRDYRITRGKWAFHIVTDGYQPVFFDAEFDYWSIPIGGIGLIVIPFWWSDWLRAFEWRGLTEDAHQTWGSK